jgi:hypothetical protein
MEPPLGPTGRDPVYSVPDQRTASQRRRDWISSKYVKRAELDNSQQRGLRHGVLSYKMYTPEALSLGRVALSTEMGKQTTYTQLLMYHSARHPSSSPHWNEKGVVR